MTASEDNMLSPGPRHAPAVDGGPPPASKPASANHQLLFKKHKVLPHPRKDASYAGLRGPRPMALARKQDLPAAAVAAIKGALSDYVSDAASHPSSPPNFNYSSKKLGSGPDLPPTPPAHSRNSSTSYSILPSSAAYVQSPEQSTEDVQIKPTIPITPTKQMSPPTPDVTPPNAVELGSRPKNLPTRAATRERGLSKGTNDSQSESFKTARENPSSGDDDDGDALLTLRPAPSARTSESTVRRVSTAAGTDETAVKNGNSYSDTTPNGRAARNVAGTNIAINTKRHPQAVGLGLGLESSPEQSLTPKSKRNLTSFDGEWGTFGNDEVVQEWDDNLDRNVVVRKRRGLPPNNIVNGGKEVIEDTTVAPTNATQAVRSMSLPQRILTFPSPNESPEQPRRYRKELQTLAFAAPITAHMATAANPFGNENRRVSTISTKSTTSTVIEAYLVDAPLQRRKTLRHVKKQISLRDSISDLSHVSSAPTSFLDDGGKQQQQQQQQQRIVNSGRYDNNKQYSIVSTSTAPSVSSRSARRDILKAGGIPVVVVPDRRSSAKPTSREPSLRSTSSRRSKTSQSVHSVPLSQLSSSGGRGMSSNDSQASRRRSRAYSESDGSIPGDQRTLDYPPVVPKRTSSLSAPTSRNVSRSGSLTAESVKAHAELLQSKLKAREEEQRPSTRSAETLSEAPVTEIVQPTRAKSRKSAQGAVDNLFPTVNVEQASSVDLAITPTLPHERGSKDTDKETREHRIDQDAHHDRASNMLLLSPQNTPFSVASADTATSHHSHAEVSEALAISIYAHQNTSVLMVDHSNRPSECSSESHPDPVMESSNSSESKVEVVSSVPSCGSSRRFGGLAQTSSGPEIKAPEHCMVSGNGPVTPQPIFSMDDVDSPLRNPRAPPAPPAIHFIPATPSGLTPAPEIENKSVNNVSTVLRKALSRGRRTEYGPSASRTTGLIGRTLSLTRSVRRRAPAAKRPDSVDRGKGIDRDPELAEEDKLHPFWRPASFYLGDEAEFNREDDDNDDDGDEEYYRYPPIDNRPHKHRRSLSSRMKRTFAILPIDDSYESYPATSDDWPERRTVRRTPSGNLRVMKHRNSAEAAGQMDDQTAPAQRRRPQTAPQQQSRQASFWRAPSFMRRRESLDQHRGATNSGSSGSGNDRYTTFPLLSDKLGERSLQSIPRRLSERRREKRSKELRQKISGPQEVRDGVGEVIRRSNYRDAFTQAQISS